MYGAIFGLLTGIMTIIVNLAVSDKTTALFVVAGGSFILGCVFAALVASDVYRQHDKQKGGRTSAL